ncbi:hypothetical protein BGZ92_004859 [Podila epicladia]|nr:hypothetical protein BGZ92_004859 [Podila epicladia]
MVQVFEKNDNVAYIEQVRVDGLELPDASFETTATQPDDLWNLNRVCERMPGVNHPYCAPATGEGITAYVLGTGVYTDHQEFNGHASWDANFIQGSPKADENGHGTYLAGTLGGTTYGVAKEVSIIGVKVLDADGSGTNATVLAGLDWVADNAVPDKSVVNLSIGGGKDRAIDDIIKRLYDKNIPVFASAGNDPEVKSSDQSPSSSPHAYTVASMNWLDQPSHFNSPGKNVDIFAPGERILTAYIGNKEATTTGSSTAIAVPHVTGIAAIYLSLNPRLEVGELYKRLSENATPGLLSGDLKGMPNLIVYNRPV